MGVVVRRYIGFLIANITYPYSTCINAFYAAASLLLCSFFVFHSLGRIRRKKKNAKSRFLTSHGACIHKLRYYGNVIH